MTNPDKPLEPLLPNTILMGERLYAQAIELVIQQAQNTLYIFDQDFSHGDYASVLRYQSLQQFLSRDAHTLLTIVLHQSDYLVTQCPRLMELLTTYGHKMTVYTTNDSAKVAKDCFVIADEMHYVKRIHIDQARFKYALDDADTCASLHMRFNELLEETSYTLSPTQLGL
ncbi:MAG: hypothetical protein B7X98_01775 [Methylophilaceae bacterium 17-43-7]|jgi:hypothetical protein|nr:MAG: hypothetical protein B7Y48_02450 [Methylophilales bacterium 28-44-11]OYZ68723.1 MAG: hypothetical protein B7X98_01775 [Methylophilaceae bacterium 17-43-7]